MKHDVVYNNCFGGFCLSYKAVEWLKNNGSENTKKHINELEYEFSNGNLSKSLIKEYTASALSGYFQRHDSDLVAVVKALGKKASGSCSDLAIIKITGNIYRIDDYDGSEEVITPDTQYEWVTINEQE